MDFGGNQWISINLQIKPWNFITADAIRFVDAERITKWQTLKLHPRICIISHQHTGSLKTRKRSCGITGRLPFIRCFWRITERRSATAHLKFEGHQQHESHYDADCHPQELVGGNGGAYLVETARRCRASGCHPCNCGYDAVVEDVTDNGDPKVFCPVEQIAEKCT